MTLSKKTITISFFISIFIVCVYFFYINVSYATSNHSFSTFTYMNNENETTSKTVNLHGITNYDGEINVNEIISSGDSVPIKNIQPADGIWTFSQPFTVGIHYLELSSSNFSANIIILVGQDSFEDEQYITNIVRNEGNTTLTFTLENRIISKNTNSCMNCHNTHTALGTYLKNDTTSSANCILPSIELTSSN